LIFRHIWKRKLIFNALITGVIGSGKTTAANIIVEKLKEKASIIVIDPTGAWKNIAEGQIVEGTQNVGELEKGVKIFDL